MSHSAGSRGSGPGVAKADGRAREGSGLLGVVLKGLPVVTGSELCSGDTSLLAAGTWITEGLESGYESHLESPFGGEGPLEAVEKGS